MLFEELGLSPEILAGIESQGYTTPTPIQEKAIPVVLARHDILAGAQTGTGKTAAFVLPLLHLLKSTHSNNGTRPRALVLAPTRELAAQVGQSVKTYGKGLHLRSTIIYGGVGFQPQVSQLRKGVDIVIGTPGRLLDLANQRILDLSQIEFLIMDEADRMLDMGFIHDVRKIINLIPKKRQTLFFSATYSREVKKLADTILNNPKTVEIERKSLAAENIEQRLFYVPKPRKSALLTRLIKDGEWKQALVFTRTKHGANKLTKQLEQVGIRATAIHGNKSQSQRTRALANFKDNRVRILVATDVAARGLDIDQLPHVVNYDLPQVAEDYVHRIGRTGRAGYTGEAVSLVSEDEGKLLYAIERLIKKEITVSTAEGFSIPKPTFTDNPRPRTSRGNNNRNRWKRR